MDPHIEETQLAAYMESTSQNSNLAMPPHMVEECSKKTSYVSLGQHTSSTNSGSDTRRRKTTNSSSSKKSEEEQFMASEEEELEEEDAEDEQEHNVVSSSRHKSKKLLKPNIRQAAPKGQEIGEKLKQELSKYKQELKEYNETTKELEEKYMKINHELSEIQLKHTQFVAKRKNCTDLESDAEPEVGQYYGSSTSINSEASVNEKGGTIFSRNSSFMTVLAADSSCEKISERKLKHYSSGTSELGKKLKPKKSLTAQVHSVYSNHIVETLANRHIKRRKRSSMDAGDENRLTPVGLKEVYSVLKDVINTSQEQKHKHERDSTEISQLYSAIKALKNDQLQFRTTIRQQQDRIADYHKRCIKAQEIMVTQKREIEKLSSNNKQLEASIHTDIDALRNKIDAKLKSISHLPQKMREEHSKYEKALRENCLLVNKLHILQEEASGLKLKIDELGRRKLITINRLKAAERDLKIFKNYNAALKSEKRRMSDELASVKDQLDSLQATNKRQMARHREQSEKQRRDLQSRIFDLELKLNRSQNSTSSLIQERDSLIAELQTQLHTLVHNFEVSQKHIRVLRRHIYTMTAAAGGATGGAARNNTMSKRASEADSVRVSQQTGGSSVSRLNNLRTLKAKT